MSSLATVSSTPESLGLRPPVSTAGEWIHDPDFWHSDGEVILGVKSADGPENVHLFRVHQPVLELHSPVLRKILFDTPDTKPRLEGAIAIWVPETSPKTMRYFLRIMYGPYTEAPIRILTDTVLCDEFFKLCSRLNAIKTCTPMIRRLYGIWPSTLTAWDETDAYASASAQKFPALAQNPMGLTMLLFHDDVFPEPAFTIRLGRLYNILRVILPAALYHLSRIDPSSDYDRMHMEPTRSDADSQQRLNAGLRSARWSLLTPKDHQALAAFKDYVQSCLNKLIAEPSPHLACKARMKEIYSDIIQCSMATRDVLRELKLGFDEPRRICSSCITHGRRVTSLMREDIWDQLAIILGL